MAMDADPDDLLADLTPPQREAATHFEGPLLILAGPGSGKTRVITRRVAWLLRQGVRAHQILAITFTNKAAQEMRDRVAAIVPESKVLVSTFHALGARLLRQHAERFALDKNFTIYDQDDRKKIIKESLELANVDERMITPSRIEGAISRAKNQLLTPEGYGAKANDYFTEIVANVYPYYQKKLRSASALDFDDLLMLPALALRHDEEFRSMLDHRFRFLLVDEYQDTNGAQYEIARRLSVDYPNICVVGDPDQSIYRWRGSDIKNILDFERDFPDARVITLDRNYRSTQAILHAANALISHNSQRKKKDLFTENPPGASVKVLQFDDGTSEANRIAMRVRDAVQGGQRRYRDFAMFLRTNALSRSLESAFLHHGVPYQMVRGLAFYERKENRDILAYLRLILNPRDDVSFLRAVAVPGRGVGKVSLEHLSQYAAAREMSLLQAISDLPKIAAIKGKAAAGLREFAAAIADIRTHLEGPPGELVRHTIERSGYSRMLEESGTDEDLERLDNVKELITAAEQFHREDPARTINDFLETIALASDADGHDADRDSVAVMTLHAAKGLEFPVVYMLACEQGILPHQRSVESDDPAELEEERRLCYVGMTRAEEELYLCQASYREFQGQGRYTRASDFLSELPSEVEHVNLSNASESQNAARYWRGGAGQEEFAARAIGSFTAPRSRHTDDDGLYVGALIDHEEHGIGRVVALEGSGATRLARIRFARGLKAFRTAAVKLTVIEDI